MTSPRDKRLAARQAFLTEDHLRVLQRLARLRIATPDQLRRLADPFVGSSPRNVRERVARLEKHGLIARTLLHPQRGAYSPVCYRLAYGGLAALARPTEVDLLRRPRQHILEYLVFRNEAWATAREAGWRLGIPALVPEGDHQRYLDLYVAWAKSTRRRHYQQLQASGAGVADLQIAKLDFERVEKFAPKALTFDFIFKLSTDGIPNELALLVLDDPRRSIPAQVADLPSELHPEVQLLLRDHLTRYDLGAHTTYRENPRLARWRLALAKKYTTLPFTGERLLAEADATPLFPDLWAVRTAAPKVP
jgi:DNA-binding Lrp family transcriptional regulator